MRIEKVESIPYGIPVKGFADALEGPPNEQQWNRVLERLNKCYE